MAFTGSGVGVCVIVGDVVGVVVRVGVALGSGVELGSGVASSVGVVAVGRAAWAIRVGVDGAAAGSCAQAASDNPKKMKIKIRLVMQFVLVSKNSSDACVRAITRGESIAQPRARTKWNGKRVFGNSNQATQGVATKRPRLLSQSLASRRRSASRFCCCDFQSPG